MHYLESSPSCPSCKITLDAACFEDDPNERRPRAGDATYCAHCGAFLQICFNHREDLVYRQLDLNTLDQEDAERLVEYRDRTWRQWPKGGTKAGGEGSERGGVGDLT